MQIAIVSGLFTDENADIRAALPRNMLVIPKENGISNGYLRPAEGIETFGTGPGIDRGGIVWNGVAYRVMGNQFVRVNADGTIKNLGVVSGTGRASFDYSFDRLGIAAGGALYYFDGGSVERVTDEDLGNVVDVVWVDGYFMTTDGEYLVQTELKDPASVNPLKYGSAEADPDAVMGLLKLRNELYAINRYSIEQFNNVGGSFFAFERNEGAYMARGAIGTHAKCIYLDAIAFVGGAKNEPPAVWLGINGATEKISTREIDTLLVGYSEAQLRDCVLETRTVKSHQWLYVHLPDRTLVYDAAASRVIEQPVWVDLTSSIVGLGTYRARNFTWCYDRWLCGDPTSYSIGTMSDKVSTHYGETIGWEFSTSIIYNASLGALFHQLELVALPGRVTLGADPVVWASHSEDGETWSQERSCKIDRQGDRLRRVSWLRQGSMRNWRIQKFRGTSDAHLSVARLEAQLEPLNA